MTIFKTQMVAGFHWPADDQHACMVVPTEVRRIPNYLRHVPRHRRRVCIQAGGNVGVYALALANDFELVVAFEPDRANAHCFGLNVPHDHPNILLVPAALSDRRMLVETYRPAGEEMNGGAVMIRPSEGLPGSTIAAIALDQTADVLNTQLERIDFVMLDVEGHELPALAGMEHTLRANLPTVSVELKGLGNEYGGDSAVRAFLAELGYQEVDGIGRDCIFTHPGG